MTYTVRIILYATDLGPHEAEVFRHAAGMARQFGAKLHVIHVVQLLHESTHALVRAYVPSDMVHRIHDQGMVEMRQEMQKRLEAFRREESGGEPAPEVEVHVVEGLVAPTILEEARRLNADLIVMGSHGHTALGEMMLGSVAHKVVMKSTRPVVLVPVEGEA